MSKFNSNSVGIVKVAKRQTFTAIDNATLRDTTLTNESLGLLCRSLANVEEWQTNIKGAMSMSCDTKGGITRQIHHLQKNGYAHLIVEKDANTKSVLRKYYRLFEEKQNIEILPVIEFITANNEKITAKKRQTEAEKLINEVGATDENELIELLKQAKAIKDGAAVPSQAVQPQQVQPRAAEVQTIVTPPHVEIDFFTELTQDTEFLETMKTKYNVEPAEITALIDCFKGNNSAKKHLVYSDFQKHFGNWIPNGLKILATKNRTKKQAGTARNTQTATKKEIIQEVGRYKTMMEAANEHTKYSEYKETVKNLIDWTEKAVKYMNNEQITRFEELKRDYNTGGALKTRLEKQLQGKVNTPLSAKTENLISNLSQTLNVR